MTRDDVIRMAHEVGILMMSHQYQAEPTKLERFAELVAAAAAVEEREDATERVVDLFANMETPYLPDIVAAIRARSEL